MGKGGPPWRGTVLGLALLTGVLTAGATGCDGSGTHSGTTGAPEVTRTAPGTRSSPPATPPEDLCARLVAHWSRKVLAGDTYGDYQSMGLSNRQYEILLDVVDAARAEKRREGAHAAGELIDRTARERCEERYRNGNPTERPWS
ncbi:hypothetical protein GCM10010372_15620 [Streptomyces tauricus]|uniref:Lipoprotein n=1 Tax=Streptomyces tauricus TaxID=68274 RepID=A0ABZ1JP74_9ACTN|nr:hypothetical protein [Streptomyces tauricus]GHA16820.1 hypothetical protein GCM10010372_15620 [Streptomyces tauricus]